MSTCIFIPRWWKIISVISVGFFPLLASSSYFIAIKKNEGDVLDTLDSYCPLISFSKKKFYADPFLFKHQGVNYLFFEDFDSKKGIISYVLLGNEGSITSPKVALKLPIHLSFPYIFEDNENIYMVPETYQYRSISLFKSIDFPKEWKRERVLVKGEYYSDPVLFKHEGYYWLFAAIHRDELVIYYAKDLEEEFLPHPINTTATKGRNAGAPFFSQGRFIRPVMDCSIKYGRSMILKEIVLLTPEEFIEKEVATIEPVWAPNLLGTHTFSINEDFVVYDGEIIR